MDRDEALANPAIKKGADFRPFVSSERNRMGRGVVCRNSTSLLSSLLAQLAAQFGVEHPSVRIAA